MRNTSTCWHCTATMQSLQMIERDMCSRSAKAKRSNNSPCVLECEWERRCSAMRIHRGHFAATSKMAYFGRSRAKNRVISLAILALRFLGFQANFVDFQNPVFFCKIQAAATQKHKNEYGHGRRHVSWPHILAIFWKTPILSFVWPFQDWKRKSPIFSATLAIFNVTFTPTRSQKAVAKTKDQKSAVESLIFSIKTTPDISHLLR